MAKSSVVLPREVGLLRICAQGLVPRTSSSGVVGVVERLLAIQGQQVSAVPHALLARSTGTVGSDVSHAFAQGLLVRHRPMRGTVHITHARDFHWMRLALMAHFSAWDMKHYTRLGIDDEVAKQAAQAAHVAIAAAGGAISRTALFAAWQECLDTTHLASEDVHRWCQLLMWRTAHEGAVIEGPMGRNQHFFIDARTLPAADSPESGFHLTSETRQDGLVEIARRYIHGHGPVLVDDFAWWAGMSKTTATHSLEAALEVDTRLGRYCYNGDHLMLAKPAQRVQERTQLLYMPHDLPDVLAEQRREALTLMFLPSFDEIYIGYANRTCLTDSDGDSLISQSRNGMLRPLIIHQGQLIGVRPAAQGLQWLERPANRLATQTERLVERTFERLRL